jgi:effector-binding domain-containing protein
MNLPRFSRLALVALIPTAALSLGLGLGGFGSALAQSPAAPPVTSTPATPAPAPTPTSPGPTTASPASPSPTSPGPTAQTPTPPPAPGPVQTADPFGEQIALTPKTVVIVKGSANWDAAFETLLESFKLLSAALDKQGIKSAGNPMIVYTSTDDTGFTYLAEIPVDQEPKNLSKTMSMGKSPDGKALKFVHRGSYDNMDNTYEAITNHLDDKKLEAKDTFIEEYITDPLKTAEDKLVINVYVPLK